MLETLTQVLGPYYLKIKFVHLLFATMWLWSTSVAYLNYVVPTMKAWLRSPNSEDALRDRNSMMERFDHGVILEHIAFPVVLLSGVCLLLAGGWTAQSYWLVIKLSVVVLVFLPIEIIDYWLSHFGGNKLAFRRRANVDALASPRYEQLVQYHWWFLVVTTPIIATAGMLVVYLATVKPA